MTRRQFPLVVLVAAAVCAPGAARSQSWTEITPLAGPAPSPRALASGIHDSCRNRLVIFGGQGASGFLNDVWAFDLTNGTWTELTPAMGAAPAPRRTPNSVYDPVADRMITWSGQGSSFFNDSWAFDFTGNTWTELEPPDPKPEIRYGVASVRDPVTHEMVSFAGFTSSGRFQDTWRLNPAAETWTDVTPGSPSPAARCLHSASYDSVNRRMIMYGGQISGATGDIWALDLASNAWEELTPAVSPLGRWHATNVYDSANDRVTVFGGNRGGAQGGKTNEVHLFHLDRNEWQPLALAGTEPTPREGSPGVYVPGEDRLVVFGGHDGGWLDEVWSLDDLSEAVTTPLVETPGTVVSLDRSRPNPFRVETVIEFEIPRALNLGVTIHDVAGKRVRTLWNGRAAGGPGRVVWDGRDGRGARVGAGTYFLRLQVPGQTRSQKLVFLGEK